MASSPGRRTQRLEGFASKRGTSGFFSQLKANRRFFVIDEDGLRYAEDAASLRKHPRKIDLLLASVERRSATGLDIATSDRRIPLDFPNAEERDSWHDAILAEQLVQLERLQSLVSRLEAHADRLGVANARMPPNSLSSARTVSQTNILDDLGTLVDRLERIPSA